MIFEDDNNYGNGKSNQLTDEQIDKMIDEAFNYYDKESYYLALEKFELLYNLNELSSYGKMFYANCLYFTDKFEEALNIYTLIQKNIEVNYSDRVCWLYSAMGDCYRRLNNESSALLYFEKLKYIATPWSFYQKQAVSYISLIYKERNEKYRAIKFLEDYLYEYIKYKGFYYTDCWTKSRRDELIAEKMFECYLCSDSPQTRDSYLMYSAGWGDERAINVCRELGINYLNPKIRKY